MHLVKIKWTLGYEFYNAARKSVCMRCLLVLVWQRLHMLYYLSVPIFFSHIFTVLFLNAQSLKCFHVLDLKLTMRRIDRLSHPFLPPL